MKTAIFYFDYISPYAYFTWDALQKNHFAESANIEYRPVLFAGLLNHWEQKGPAEIPAKRVFLMKQTLRYAARHHIPFEFPAYHPFVPLHALRVSLPCVAGDQQMTVMRALWEAAWVKGQDLADAKVVIAALCAHGLDGEALFAKTRESEAKNQLRIYTETAIEEGVFGVPSIVVDKEVFWGNDSLIDVEDYLAGEDGLEPEKIAAFLNRPSGATR